MVSKVVFISIYVLSISIRCLPLTLTFTLPLHFSLVAHYVRFKLFVLNNSRVVRVYDLKEWIDEFSFDRDTELSNEIGDFINGQGPGSIQVKIVKDLSQEVWIVLGKLQDSRLDL